MSMDGVNMIAEVNVRSGDEDGEDCNEHGERYEHGQVVAAHSFTEHFDGECCAQIAVTAKNTILINF